MAVERTPSRRFPAEPLALADVEALRAACSRRAPTGIRNRALLAVLFRSGLRVSEALALLPKDHAARRPDRLARTVSPVMKIVPVLLALLLIGAAPGHAQTWQTDPAFGARRDAYGPGVHMDAIGRVYRDTPSNAWLFEPVRPTIAL